MDNEKESLRRQDLGITVLTVSLISFVIFLHWSSHFREQLWIARFALFATTLTMDTILFSTYFSIRTTDLNNSREYDVQAFNIMLNIKDKPSKEEILSLVNLLSLSENERRISSVRYGSAIFLTSGGVFFGISFLITIVSDNSLWMVFYSLGLISVLFGIVTHLWNLGYVIHRKWRRFLSVNRARSKICKKKYEDALLVPLRKPFMIDEKNIPKWWRLLIDKIETRWFDQSHVATDNEICDCVWKYIKNQTDI